MMESFFFVCYNKTVRNEKCFSAVIYYAVFNEKNNPVNM